MESVDLMNLRLQVMRYIRSFSCDDREEQKNIALKEQHTLNVAAIMAELAAALCDKSTFHRLAEAIGLLHDIGRFPQFVQYRTFRDSKSLNHGRLGCEVIGELNLLGSLLPNEQELIHAAVRFHNAFAIPPVLDPETQFFLKMIRDADKLDIWRIFAEYYEKPAEERESAAGLGLPDRPECSSRVLACLTEKRLSRLADLTTIHDFGIMQLSWIYDLNFPVSFRLAAERGDLERIIAHLPRSEELAQGLATMREYMQNRAAE